MATYNLTSSIPSISSLQSGDILNCSYSGTYKAITLPPGIYTLDCWGAQGGYYTSATYTNAGNNKGGHSTGVLTLNDIQTLYLYVGGQGTNISASTSGKSGGWNGGASGGSGTNSNYGYGGAGGGGASDIRIGSTSLYARVIVAGGGGGQGPGSTQGGATSTNNIPGIGTYDSYGGGSSGAKGSLYINSSAQSNDNYMGSGGSGQGGTQTSAGAGGSGGYTNSNNDGTYYPPGGSGGGGGWYGGGGGAGGGYDNGSASIGYSGNSGSFGAGGSGGSGKSGAGFHAGAGGGGGGGSGYVYTSSTASSYPSGCQLNSNYYLASATTSAGNESFAAPISAGGVETGHSGNGYIQIVVNSIDNITNGAWTYTLDSILRPSTTLSTTSAWNLTGSTCKKFKIIPSSSGFLQVYSTNSNNGDTYGYITTSDVTTISSQGAPSSYQYRNDDDGEGNNFKIVIPVAANTTYYLWVRPYSSSSTVSSTVISYQVINPRITGVYVKTATSTWVQVK